MKIKEIDVLSNKVFSDEKIAIASNINIGNLTSKKKINNYIEMMEIIKPDKIIIPGNLYYPTKDMIDGNTIIEFLDSLANIADVIYLKGKKEMHSELLPNDLYDNVNSKIHVLGVEYANCEGGKRRWEIQKLVNFEEMNIAGIRFQETFYSKTRNEKVNTLINRYKEYLEKVAYSIDENKFNILISSDDAIKASYKYLSVLKYFDLVISTSPYILGKNCEMIDNTTFINTSRKIELI